MRKVKQVDGFFTLGNKSCLEDTDHLCDQYGDGECTIRAIMNRVKINRFNAKLAVMRCMSFIPSLTFRDSNGLDSEFNTF